MKKTALDIVKEDRVKLVEEIIEGLKNKGMKWFQEWSNLAVPHNGTNETVYKGGNKVKLGTIALKNSFKDPRWATKKQIQEKGWKLQPEAKAALCEYWKFKELDPDKETGEIRTIPMVNFFNVYNFSQILDEKGEPLKAFEIPERHKDEELQKILTKLEKASKCSIEYLPQERAYYNSKNDIIVLPSPDLFKNDEAQIKTLLHEMSHSTGHQDRMNRDINHPFGSPEYAKEELRAEISSMFLQANLGITGEDRNFNNNQAYIESWISALKDDPNEIYRASSEADKIADYIMEEYKEIEKAYEQELKEQEENKDKVIEIESPIKENEQENQRTKSLNGKNSGDEHEQE
ncbi:ArdC family protein [Cetobacterium sp.]|uniref:ArdC family protein n=1 Tax=Cetobacterium sp. TaxID=2071632 RepID=UPI0025BE669D|nr:zincin-like metallopeptidase domain-containing protein [Cetobacterium sp.]